MKYSVRQCTGIFLTTVAVGAALRCVYQVAPGTVLGLFVPVNESVWELSKIALWPAVAAVLLWHIRCRDRKSLCAYLMVPAALPVALLFVYWFLRMVCGICSGLLDAAVWVCLLAVGYLTAHALRRTQFASQALFMVCVLLFVWAFVYTLFTLQPVDLPLFRPAGLYPAMAPADLPC